MATPTIRVMALDLAGRPLRPITADEAMAMVDAGILHEGDRVELLHGVLTQMSPQNLPHATLTQRLTRWLAPLMVAGTHDVRVQLPLRVPDQTSLPEPDFAVIDRDDAQIDHPDHARLIIEVADSSVGIDTRVKAPLYASAGVPDYWVLNVPLRLVEVFRDRHDDGYGTRTEVAAPDRPVPLGLDIEPLDLEALFSNL
jgi:Uma2 family endonuclease